jgi:hypothetical protein
LFNRKIKLKGRKNKMKTLKNKIAAITIVIFFILSMTVSITLIPTASAHNPAWQIPTYAYISVMPNPIGVGQQMTCYVWLSNVYDSAAIGNNYRFQNYQVVITAPDGTPTTQNFAFIADSTSSQLFYFTPDQVGTYIFNFTFPGQAITTSNDLPTSAYINDTYLPSSASTTLTVQQAPIPAAKGSSPLPTAFWERPIFGENDYWYTISSNWLGTGSPQYFAINYDKNTFAPDNVGSKTGHVMWTKPLESGGVVGGNLFPSSPGVGYFEGSAYNNRYANPIIMDGMLFYTEPISFAATAGVTDCVNLVTGQLIWSRSDVPVISFGYIYNLWDPNQHGTLQPLLCTTNFARVFDAFTGDPLFNVTNVPSGTTVLGPNGEQLKYVITNDGNATNPQWYMAEWNSTKLWQWTGMSPTLANASLVGPNGVPQSITGGTPPAIPTPPYNTNGGISNTYVVTANCANPASPYYNYDWNISLPWLNVMGNQTASTVTFANGTTAIRIGYSATGANPDASNPSTVIAGFYNDILLCRNGSLSSMGRSFYGNSYTPYTYFGVDLNSAHSTLGNIMWMQTFDPAPGNLTVLDSGVDPVARVFYESYKELPEYVAYSMNTGQKLWGPTAEQPALDYYGNDFGGDLDAQCAYGRLYSVGFAGILYCYNETNGDLLWTYGNGGEGNSTYAGLNTFYGDYPTFIQAIGDGIIYTDTTEHTITDPIYKGALTRAINATDGTEIWTLPAYTGGGTNIAEYAIADGYTTFFNGYDDQIYVVGRGPSATTVTAPNAGLTFGQSVVIRGTVTDISSGTKQDQQAANFPNGVPVSSDSSMSDWMGYVYQQKPLPTNFTGVPVTIAVLDSNGNYRTIGTATTDASSAYCLTWIPDIPGTYTVIATFQGAKGYWSSYSETAFNVMNAPAATATAQTYPQQIDNTMTIVGVGVAVLVAIAIVGVVMVMMIRKRP